MAVVFDGAIIRFISLPSKIRGTTIPDVEGNFNVYINKNLNYETQIEIFRHELAHIKNGDFWNGDSIRVVEERADYNKKRKGIL